MNDYQEMNDILELLQNKFGFKTFIQGQQEIINHLLSGHSALAVFPTGGGKSLCYQLPALVFDGLTLVVSPLIALMKDQIDFLKQKEIMAERLDSTMEPGEIKDVMTKLRHGQLQLLYVAPERFTNERFFEAIQDVKIDLFAVDEAHCISEWGHNFRPDYMKLAKIAHDLGIPRILALTATATPTVVNDICVGFGINQECVVQTGFYRHNLVIKTTAVSAKDRDKVLLKCLLEHPIESCIVYVTRQKTAESIAEMLNNQNIRARPYHAGLDRDSRMEIQEWFMHSNDAVIVATIAFGMGIDKANIRQVIHYNLPKSLENYSQEIGRAGRDGATSYCEILACPNDVNLLENFVYGDTPTKSAIVGVLKEIFTNDKEFQLNLYELSFTHNMRLLVLRTLLMYLELDGYIHERTPFFLSYRFQPVVPIDEIIPQFSGEEAQFLKNVFQHSTKARIWHHIDINKTAEVLCQPRKRLVHALDDLHENGYLLVKASHVRHRYTLLRQPDDISQLEDKLFHRFVERENKDIKRVQQVINLVTNDGCQTNHLVGYFGEELLSNCGHCNWCMNGNKPVALPHVPEFTLTNDDVEGIDAVWQMYQEVFSEPRILALFLCGITSPKISRAGLTTHHYFGFMESVRFHQVLDSIRVDDNHLLFSGIDGHSIVQ